MTVVQTCLHRPYFSSIPEGKCLVLLGEGSERANEFTVILFVFA